MDKLLLGAWLAFITSAAGISFSAPNGETCFTFTNYAYSKSGYVLDINSEGITMIQLPSDRSISNSSRWRISGTEGGFFISPACASADTGGLTVTTYMTLVISWPADVWSIDRFNDGTWALYNTNQGYNLFGNDDASGGLGLFAPLGDGWQDDITHPESHWSIFSAPTSNSTCNGRASGGCDKACKVGIGSGIAGAGATSIGVLLNIWWHRGRHRCC